MLVVTPFHPGDQDQALRQAEWIKELGGCAGHEILLIRDTRVSEEITAKIRTSFMLSFDKGEVLDFVDHYHSWPRACNAAFSEAARHIMRTRSQPWFLLEPDAVPLSAGWLDAIWAEYQKAGRPFLGDFVSAATAGVNVIDHCSGVAIYPADMFKHAGLALIADETAWDVAAASQIVPQMHKSELMLHRWKHGAFESWEQVQSDIFDKKPGAVLFHASKDGSLILRLREHNLSVPVLADQTTPYAQAAEDRIAPESTRRPSQIKDDSNSSNSGGGQFICDIFIKTYPPDYPWLKYCLRSIDKFVSGVRGVSVLTQSDDQAVHPLSFGDLRVTESPEFGEDGYLSQQVFKLYADTHTDSEFILYIDSDTIFTQPVTPETYFTDGRPNWMMTPWAKTDTPWRPIVEKFLGRPVEFEFMRRHPQCVPRWLLVAMRAFCEQQHGMTLYKYVMSQPLRAFSEFNALGAFAYAFHRDRFHWINTEEVPESEWPPLTVLQKFSWGGLTPEIEAELESILSPASNLVFTESTPLTLILPNLDEEVSGTLVLKGTVDDAQDLASRLKTLCSTNAETRRIRRILHDTGVIKLDYLYRKRKGWKRKNK